MTSPLTTSTDPVSIIAQANSLHVVQQSKQVCSKQLKNSKCNKNCFMLVECNLLLWLIFHANLDNYRIIMKPSMISLILKFLDIIKETSRISRSIINHQRSTIKISNSVFEIFPCFSLSIIDLHAMGKGDWNRIQNIIDQDRLACSSLTRNRLLNRFFSQRGVNWISSG